jgi:hypothetical protein
MSRILTPEQQAAEHAKALAISRRWRDREAAGEASRLFMRELYKARWRKPHCILIRKRPLWIWRSRLRAMCWRALRRIPAIDRWAGGCYFCRR